MPDSSFDADIAPSRAERRAAFAAAQATADAWGEIDFSLLEERRAAVPPFPLDLLPQPWRDWTSDTASSDRGAGGLCRAGGAGGTRRPLRRGHHGAHHAGLVRALGAVAGGARRAVHRQVVCPRADAPAARRHRGRTPRARRRAPGASCRAGRDGRRRRRFRALAGRCRRCRRRIHRPGRLRKSARRDFRA